MSISSLFLSLRLRRLSARLWLLTGVLLLAGCSHFYHHDCLDKTSMQRLEAVLAAKPEEMKARYTWRHPRETLAFFAIKPGMKVAEVLPGSGWYTQILAPYIGSEGALHGINYADDMWALFGFFDEAGIAQRIASMEGFAAKVESYAGQPIPSQGFAFKRVPASLQGQLDAVVMVRALHNLNRFEAQAGTLSQALRDVHSLLKPGGIVGVVQHRAPEDADEAWANGSNGYLKTSSVIAMFEAAGFELVASSEINANPNDKPVLGDNVWRLPPTLRGSPETQEQRAAIGESDRMTLKFKKI